VSRGCGVFACGDEDLTGFLELPSIRRTVRVDRLMRSGYGIEVFCEAVQVLREQFAVSGPSSPEGAAEMEKATAGRLSPGRHLHQRRTSPNSMGHPPAIVEARTL